MVMDKILLEGIRLEIRVGTTEEERSQPQLCALDLSLETDLRSAGRSGDLSEAVDYAEVFRSVKMLCTEKSFCLLEELGHQICQEVLAKFSVAGIKLKIRKLSPFTPELGSVGVELERHRKQRKSPS
jgi:FolB domain-containing protein